MIVFKGSYLLHLKVLHLPLMCEIISSSRRKSNERRTKHKLKHLQLFGWRSGGLNKVNIPNIKLLICFGFYHSESFCLEYFIL